MIPKAPEGLIPVAKDGKFFGFADENQIRKHGLEVFDANKQATAPAEEKAAEKPAQTSASKGSDPGQVRRAPPAVKKSS